MNLTQLLLSHANDTWWASWLLHGRRDEYGNETQLAEGKFFGGDFSSLNQGKA